VEAAKTLSVKTAFAPSVAEKKSAKPAKRRNKLIEVFSNANNWIVVDIREVYCMERLDLSRILEEWLE